MRSSKTRDQPQVPHKYQCVSMSPADFQCLCSNDIALLNQHIHRKLIITVKNCDHRSNIVQPYLDWAFANLKRLGGKMPPPNLAISSQMTVKLGKDIL